MGQTKAMLEERIETLTQELRHEIARRKGSEAELKVLYEENRQLADLISHASERYEKLWNYVKTLRAWASENVQ